MWWIVWDYVGSEYLIGEIERSCDGVNEKEEIVEWIQAWKQEETKVNIERSHGNGQKRSHFSNAEEA